LDPETIDRDRCPELDAIEAATGDTLTQIFGHGTVEYNRYQAASNWYRGPLNYAYHVPREQIVQSLCDSKQRALTLLKSAIKSLEERFEISISATEKSNSFNETNRHKMTNPKQIFIVHGHDDADKISVARFIEKLQFEPIILHEQTNQGRTIIEKFETFSNVGFAVVLLTPDDIGGAVNQETQPRARQNVILELGYFLGRLGRSHVCALMKDGVEPPSDFSGVVYLPFDEHDGWQRGLANELQSAGYNVDWNKVMGKR